MARPSKSQGGSGVTRQAIVDASFRLFSSKGFTASSMREIAAEAGITAGSIYNHFADKEQIFTAVIVAYHPVARVFPVLSQVEGQTVEELVHDAARRIMAEIDRYPGIFNLLVVEMVELEGRHIPELVEAMLPHVQHFVGRIYSSGTRLRPVDPIEFFRAFIGVMLGYGLTRRTFQGAGMSDAAEVPLDEFVEYFLRGVIEE